MNKLQHVSSKIFSPEFLTLIQTMPDDYVDDKHVEQLVENIHTQLKKKRISDCLVALTFYLASMLASNEHDLVDALQQLREYNISEKVEQYIN